jgi:hypothetical protein
MSIPESLEALRSANPRLAPGFDESVEATAAEVRARLAETERPRGRRLLVRVSAGGLALAAAALAAAFLVVDWSGGRTGVESAEAAVSKAAATTAASADLSGTAVVRMTHGGEPWAGKRVRWHRGDLAVSSDFASGPDRARDELLVVGGILYGIDPEVADGWLELGSPENMTWGSGTAPAEYLASVRADVGGETLRRITGAMSGLTTGQLADGSTVYHGRVAAGQIAREEGFKEGQTIRVLPFGYVAHDEAADPAAPLDTAVTVGADGAVREIAVRWGGGGSAWTYTVTYRDLGTTPALVAPANARSLNELRQR